jgi:hypothetical protein
VRNQQLLRRNQNGPQSLTRPLVALAFSVLVLPVGCASQVAQPSGPTPGDTTMPVTPSSPTPSPQSTPTEAGDTDLTIVVNDGSGSAVTWRLTCHPPGGTHPNPEAACRVLEANGTAALPPVPNDKACTQIYGGPETADISGTWQGKPIKSKFARNDGCQISRWKLMEGLLPPGGI